MVRRTSFPLNFYDERISRASYSDLFLAINHFVQLGKEKRGFIKVKSRPNTAGGSLHISVGEGEAHKVWNCCQHGNEKATLFAAFEDLDLACDHPEYVDDKTIDVIVGDIGPYLRNAGHLENETSVDWPQHLDAHQLVNILLANWRNASPFAAPWDYPINYKGLNFPIENSSEGTRFVVKTFENILNQAGHYIEFLHSGHNALYAFGAYVRYSGAQESSVPRIIRNTCRSHGITLHSGHLDVGAQKPFPGVDHIYPLLGARECYDLDSTLRAGGSDVDWLRERTAGGLAPTVLRVENPAITAYLRRSELSRMSADQCFEIAARKKAPINAVLKKLAEAVGENIKNNPNVSPYGKLMAEAALSAVSPSGSWGKEPDEYSTEQLCGAATLSPLYRAVYCGAGIGYLKTVQTPGSSEYEGLIKETYDALKKCAVETLEDTRLIRRVETEPPRDQFLITQAAYYGSRGIDFTQTPGHLGPAF